MTSNVVPYFFCHLQNRVRYESAPCRAGPLKGDTVGMKKEILAVCAVILGPKVGLVDFETVMGVSMLHGRVINFGVNQLTNQSQLTQRTPQSEIIIPVVWNRQ